MCDCYSKVFNGIHIFEDRNLKSVRSLSFICSLPSYLHYIAFAWLKSHTPFPCPISWSIYILLKFHWVLYTSDFTIGNTVICEKSYFWVNVCGNIIYVCTERTMDQERSLVGHLTKLEPNPKFHRLQQFVVFYMYNKERNLSICVSFRQCHNQIIRI